MTKSEHTPGPWYWERARTQRHLTAEGRGSFAQVSIPLGSLYDEDAALIAAAPDLLNALETIIESGYLDGGYQPTVDMALAAIAKAKGAA